MQSACVVFGLHHRHVMRTKLSLAAVGLLTSVVATPAWAQRAPAPGMLAIGGSVGLTVSSDPNLDNGLEAAGNVEAYLTSRVSIRGQVAGSQWDVVGHSFTGTVSPLRVDGNVVYNWEGGAVHPYLTGGVGAYRYHSALSGAPEASVTHAGVDVGGGIEYFFRRRATLTAEALYHHVGAFVTPLTTFDPGSYWSIDFGLKGYVKR